MNAHVGAEEFAALLDAAVDGIVVIDAQGDILTFNAAAGRHEARRTLVMDEANAVERLWLRADFLVEPYRSATRDLIRQYVDLRVKAISGQIDVAEAVLRSAVPGC